MNEHGIPDDNAKAVELQGDGPLGWWRADVFVGPVPVIKLMLALQVVAAVGAWWR